MGVVLTNSARLIHGSVLHGHALAGLQVLRRGRRVAALLLARASAVLLPQPSALTQWQYTPAGFKIQY